MSVVLKRKGVPVFLYLLPDTLPSFSLRLLQFRACLLALMSVFSQSLLTLVSSHFVALLFLSVWHSSRKLNNLYCCYRLFHLGDKALSRFECREIVSVDDDGGVL